MGTAQDTFKHLNFDRQNRGHFVSTGRRLLHEELLVPAGSGIASEWAPTDGYSVVTVNIMTDIDSDISCDIEWSFSDDEEENKVVHGKTPVFGSGEQPTQSKSNLGFVSGPWGRTNIFNNGVTDVTVTVWGYARTF